MDCMWQPHTCLTPFFDAAVFRSAFAEDRLELGEKVFHDEGGFRELRLRRLV